MARTLVRRWHCPFCQRDFDHGNTLGAHIASEHPDELRLHPEAWFPIEKLKQPRPAKDISPVTHT